jgi:hypothetical protein
LLIGLGSAEVREKVVDSAVIVHGDNILYANVEAAMKSKTTRHM